MSQNNTGTVLARDHSKYEVVSCGYAIKVSILPKTER